MNNRHKNNSDITKIQDEHLNYYIINNTKDKISNNTSKLSIDEIYNQCYNQYLKIGLKYRIDENYLDKIISGDMNGYYSLKLLKKFELNKEQIEKILISFLDSRKNINKEIIEYCLINIDMNKKLSKNLTELYINILFKKDEEDNEDDWDDEEEDDDYDDDDKFQSLYNLLLNARYVDKDSVLKQYFCYFDTNDFLLDTALNIDDIDLLSIEKNYLDNVSEVNEIIKFASLIKVPNTDLLDKHFINNADSIEDYLNYVKENINEMNTKLLTKNFCLQILDVNSICLYTEAILKREESINSLFILKNKFIELSYHLLSNSFECDSRTLIRFMILLGGKINIDELYAIYIEHYIGGFDDIENLFRNIDVPQKFIENSNPSIIDALFEVCNYEEIYLFLKKYSIFSADILEKKLIQNLNIDNIKPLLQIYSLVENLNFKKIQESIIKISNSNEYSLGLYWLAFYLDESDKELLFDYYLKIKPTTNVLMEFMKLLEINEDWLIKIRNYMKAYIYNSGFIYNICVNYPNIINEDFETYLISQILDKYILLNLFQYFDTVSNNFLINIINTKSMSKSEIMKLYYKSSINKQKNVLHALIITNPYTETFEFLLKTHTFTEDEKFDLLIKFDSENRLINKFLKTFISSTRTVDVIENIIKQHDKDGELCYLFALYYPNADKNKLFKYCIEKNLCRRNLFLEIPNIIIPPTYFDNIDLFNIYEMITDSSYKHIRSTLEKHLIIKDKTGEYLYKILKTNDAINPFEIYNALIKKKTIYGFKAKHKLKKIYSDSQYEKELEINMIALENYSLLNSNLEEDLFENDILFLKFQKIKFKLNKLKDEYKNNDSVDLISKNIIQTLNIKKDLLKDELIINELSNYFESILIYLDSIITADKEYTNFIENNLNEKVADEIKYVSNIISSTAAEIENQNKIIKGLHM